MVERVTLEVDVHLKLKDVLAAGKAAKYLGISRMTLWRWVSRGKITPLMLDHAYFHIGELDRVKALREKQEGDPGG